MLTDVDRAHKHASKHRGEVLASRICGCFYCLGTFPPWDITEWVDDSETALCPKCGIDSVLGSKSGCPVDDRKFMERMYERWFSCTRVRKP